MYDLAPRREPAKVRDCPRIHKIESWTSPSGSRKKAVIVSPQPKMRVTIDTVTLTVS